MNIFNPQVVVIGGGVIAAGELLLAPAREVMLERALAPGKDVVRVEAARFGPEAGMLGAALLARDMAAGIVTGAIEARPHERGRLVVCPTPIGNLEDVTLRVLAALREADVVACEDTRHTRVLLERYGVSATLVTYHEHNERARAAELVERMRGGDGRRAGVATPGMPLVSDPGFVLVQGCVAAGLAVEVLPGPSARADRAGGQRAALGRVALRRLPAAQAGRAGAVFASPETVVAFESPRRVGASLAVLAAARPRPARRRLPRADQAARGGRARHGRRARRALRRRRRRAARSCSSSGGAPERAGARPGGGRGRAHAGRVRRARAGRGEGGRRAHGRSANALYREVAT